MILQTRKHKITLLFVFLTALTFAQDDDIGTEVINVVRPYTPSVSDAFKVKETPVLTDTDTTAKQEVNYSIFSVPVASTFAPAKGKATTLERARREKLFDNYARLGFGNYTSVLGELYSNFELSRTDNVGLFFKHNSAQGGIKDVLVDDKFYDTSLDINYSSLQKDMAVRVDFGLLHQLYNWYGLNNEFTYTPEFLSGIDPQHSYFGVNAGANVKFDNAIFSEGDVQVRYFGDSFSSSEISARLQPRFNFDLGGHSFNLDLDVDYLSGSFERTYINPDMGINYGFTNLGASPSILLQNNELSLSAGAAVYYSMDMENSESEIFFYPRVRASYRLVDEFVTAYAGVEGGLDQNSNYKLTRENPFLSPTLFIVPTDRSYDAFGGVKGKLTNTVAYNLKASYKRENNRALFQSNPYKGTNPDFEGYEYGNSFGVVYDDMNTMEVFGELQVEINKDLSLGINASYFAYAVNNQAEAWNLPDVTATAFVNFNITERVYGGVSLFFVGERKDLFRDQSNPFNFSETVVTLDSYFDANAHVGYRVNEQLSVFARVSNIAGDTYEKWYNVPVLGLQVMGGATYKFDW